MYTVIFASKAKKIFKKLDNKSKKIIGRAIDELAENPFKKSNVVKLKNKGALYRLRVSRWRIVYILFTIDKIIEVQDIFMRKEDDDYDRRLRAVLLL